MKKYILWSFLFLFTSNLLSAQFIFQGKVVDENEDPLIGATVMIKGTVIGTVTDINGVYSLTSSDSIAILRISYMGYNILAIKAVSNIEKVSRLSKKNEFEEILLTTFPKKTKERKRGIMKDMARSNQAYLSIVPRTEPAPNWNTEDYAYLPENRFYKVTKTPLSTFSIDVDAASYSNLRRFIRDGQLPPKDAVRIEEMVNYFEYDYSEPTGEHPFEVITEISDCPWNKQHRLVHIGMQGKKIATDNLPSSNLVFLIDVSGSMSASNKLPLLQASFKLLTNQLRDKDRVAIVVYAGAAGTVLPSTTGNNKQKIKDALNKLQAGGSTAGAAGIQLAYKIAKENFIKEGNNRVILATDGDFNVGTSSDAELVRLIEKERESGVFLTVLGFGMGNYKDNKMQELANKGNGNHAYIDDINEAKKVLVNEFGGTLFTIAKDVKFQLEFNPAKVQGYRLIGYENRLLDAVDFNDDKKDAGELGAGHTVTALYEIIPVGIKSEFLAAVDDLKYQQIKVNKTASKSGELLMIKLRYKKPDGVKSHLIEKPVIDRQIDLKRASENFRFSAAVAEFGLLLRDSDYKSKATYQQAVKLAKSAKGKDENGYRMELIRMIETVSLLSSGEVVKKE